MAKEMPIPAEAAFAYLHRSASHFCKVDPPTVIPCCIRDVLPQAVPTRFDRPLVAPIAAITISLVTGQTSNPTRRQNRGWNTERMRVTVELLAYCWIHWPPLLCHFSRDDYHFVSVTTFHTAQVSTTGQRVQTRKNESASQIGYRTRSAGKQLSHWTLVRPSTNECSSVSGNVAIEFVSPARLAGNNSATGAHYTNSSV